MTALLFPCLERPGWGHWSKLATSGHTSLPSPPRDPGYPELWVPGHLRGGLTSSAPTWAQGTPQPPQTDAGRVSRMLLPPPAPRCSARAWLALTNCLSCCSSAGPRAPLLRSLRDSVDNPRAGPHACSGACLRGPSRWPHEARSGRGCLSNPFTQLTEACSARTGQWDAEWDSLPGVRPGLGELGPRVSTLLACQAAWGCSDLKATC